MYVPARCLSLGLNDNDKTHTQTNLSSRKILFLISVFVCFLDPCGSLPPCQNGGICESIEPDQYKCLCAEGFAGTTCEDIGSEGGSSSTAIAGAVSAVVLLLIIAGAALGVVVLFLWWRRKRQRHIVVQGIVITTQASNHT